MAIDHTVLDDMAEKIAGGLRMLGGAKQEVETQVRHVVEGALSQFDLVTDERMQVQEAMLSKAREDMEALTTRIVDLEAKIKELEG